MFSYRDDGLLLVLLDFVGVVGFCRGATHRCSAEMFPVGCRCRVATLNFKMILSRDGLDMQR